MESHGYEADQDAAFVNDPDQYQGLILPIRVPDPWHFGVDPDPRIHASD